MKTRRFDMNKNKKIRNAIKCELDGIKFDSRLEMTAYSNFKMHKIPFELKPKYVLVEAFKYRGETVRQMTLTVDFYLTKEDILLDTKGFANDVFPIKKKLLMQHLNQKGIQPEIKIIKNKKELQAFIVQILEKRGN